MARSADQAWWEKVGAKLGLRLTGFSYRYSATFMLPSGDIWPILDELAKIILNMEETWWPIETAPGLRHVDVPMGPQLWLAHKEQRWIRMGRYMPAAGLWYYSATNERSQYSEILSGGPPTHWRWIPELPK